MKNTAGHPVRFASWVPRLLILALIVTSVGAYAIDLLYAAGGAGLLVAIGCLCLASTLLPLACSRTFDPFEPLVLFSFSIFMGATLRSLLIVLAGPDNTQVMILTDGMSVADIAENAVLFPLSFLFLSFGYMLFSRSRVPIERLSVIRKERWGEVGVLAAAVILICTSIFAIVSLVISMKIDLSDLTKLSVKRAVQVSSGEIDGYARLGYLTTATELVKIALLALLISILSRKKKSPGRPGATITRKLLFVFCLLISFIWPLMSSSRTGIIEVIFGLLFVGAVFGVNGSKRAQRTKFTLIAATGAMSAVLVLVGVGLWRQVSQLSEIRDKSAVDAIVNNTVGSGNFFSIERTALIIDRVDESDKRFWGESYARLLLSPIPRTLWPEKPEIGLGTYVKSEIYGRHAVLGGYPPGMLGEAFLNFGYAGLIVMPLIFGALIRLYYNSLSPLFQSNRSVVLIYAVTVWPVGFQFAELDFSLATTNMLSLMVPALLFVALVARRAARSGLVARNPGIAK